MKINTPAPDFMLYNTQNNPVVLSEILNEGHNVLLVFLRHLG
jgi:peroxiredoxin